MSSVVIPVLGASVSSIIKQTGMSDEDFALNEKYKQSEIIERLEQAKTIKQFTQRRVWVSTRILDYEEREEHEEVEYLQSGKLAVLFFL